MDDKKAARIEQLERESVQLMEKIRAEENLSKKQKLIAEREKSREN